MEYPKPIMNMSELVELGFPKTHLEVAYHDRNQTFATKIDPTKKTSTIIFDTVGFEKWRQSMIKAQRGR